jgi:hypothetical protein
VKRIERVTGRLGSYLALPLILLMLLLLQLLLLLLLLQLLLLLLRGVVIVLVPLVREKPETGVQVRRHFTHRAVHTVRLRERGGRCCEVYGHCRRGTG